MHFTTIIATCLGLLSVSNAMAIQPEKLRELQRDVESGKLVMKRFTIAEVTTFAERTCDAGGNAQISEIDSSTINTPFEVPIAQAAIAQNVASGCQILACFAGFNCFDQTVGARLLEPGVCELKNDNDGFNFDKLVAICNN